MYISDIAQSRVKTIRESDAYEKEKFLFGDTHKDLDNWREIVNREGLKWAVVDLTMRWGIHLEDRINIDCIKESFTEMQKDYKRWIRFYDDHGEHYMFIRIDTGEYEKYWGDDGLRHERPVYTEPFKELRNTAKIIENEQCLDEDRLNNEQWENTTKQIWDEIGDKVSSEFDSGVVTRDVVRWMDENSIYGEYSEDNEYQRYPDGAMLAAVAALGYLDPDEMLDYDIAVYAEKDRWYVRDVIELWMLDEPLDSPDHWSKHNYGHWQERILLKAASSGDTVAVIAGDYAWDEQRPTVKDFCEAQNWYYCGSVDWSL